MKTKNPSPFRLTFALYVAPVASVWLLVFGLASCGPKPPKPERVYPPPPPEEVLEMAPPKKPLLPTLEDLPAPPVPDPRLEKVPPLRGPEAQPEPKKPPEQPAQIVGKRRKRYVRPLSSTSDPDVVLKRRMEQEDLAAARELEGLRVPLLGLPLLRQRA